MSTPPTSILAAFLDHAARDPERPCVIWQGAPISYGRLAAAAAAWRDNYVNLSVTPGDRVGLYLGSSPTFIAAYLGAHMARAAVVLMNTQYRQAELSHIIGDSEPKVVVTDPSGAAVLEEVRSQKPEVRSPNPEPRTPNPEPRTPEAPLILLADPTNPSATPPTPHPPRPTPHALPPTPHAPRPTPHAPIPKSQPGPSAFCLPTSHF